MLSWRTVLVVHFAYPLPWWLGVLMAAAVGGLTFAAYRRPLVPLTRVQRIVLVSLRALLLTTLVLLMFRPIVLVQPPSTDAVVPVLVDVSRSMRLNDDGGQTRLARAKQIVETDLLPVLGRRSVLYSVGDRLEPAGIDRLTADGRQSDLSGALAAIRERYRGQSIAGVVLLSDGGDTGHQAGSDGSASSPPVFAIGVGRPDLRDREVAGIVAGEQRLDQASVDLRVSVTSSGFGRTPFQLRLLANGRELESRRVAPGVDGTSIDEVFTVSPDAATPTVYRAEIPAGEAEAVVENNSRTVLVSPVVRRRRLLVIEGAPGFDHSFMQRAWSRDPGLEVDAVVRKGRNAEGHDTFFVQAAAERAAALAQGFPSRREELYGYDGLVLANMEGDFFTREQLTTIAEFVAERGGGLLVVGGRSFAQRGMTGTPLESVLPVDPAAARGATTPGSRAAVGLHNRTAVTGEGETHPATRIGHTLEETRRLWSALPSLAANAAVGGPRPGATVLVVTEGATGGISPVIAVQQYGRGRSMVFAGEGSWRWRMMMPSEDRTYELVWRQIARWITSSSPDPVTISAPPDAEAGEARLIDVDVRDAVFAPVGDAVVDAHLTGPDGQARPLKIGRAGGASGRYSADAFFDRDGLYRVNVEARRGQSPLGSAVRWLYVGGVAREFVDPRLNEPWLRRVARASGGRYVRPAEASQVVGWLQERAPEQAAPQSRDLWHEPWAFALIALLLSAEWITRRRWGLR
jgi:uncharacterized membrane protein